MLEFLRPSNKLKEVKEKIRYNEPKKVYYEKPTWNFLGTERNNARSYRGARLNKSLGPGHYTTPSFVDNLNKKIIRKQIAQYSTIIRNEKQKKDYQKNSIFKSLNTKNYSKKSVEKRLQKCLTLQTQSYSEKGYQSLIPQDKEKDIYSLRTHSRHVIFYIFLPLEKCLELEYGAKRRLYGQPIVSRPWQL